MEAAKTSARDVHALAGLSTSAIPVTAPSGKRMRALELRAYDGMSLVHVNNRPIATPEPGEVLVKVHAAPVRGSDLLALQGQHGKPRPLPMVPGSECSGLVVQTGGGLLGRALLGRRVAYIASTTRDGTWAEFACVPAAQCVPLRSYVSFEQGATLLQSGMLAFALLDAARAKGAKAIAHTAGGTRLGRMLTLLAMRRQLPVLHIIEHGEQGQTLAGMGATHILNSGSTLYPQQLAAAMEKLEISVVIDAVAGPRTDLLLRALPQGGTLYLAGVKPDADCNIDPSELILLHKHIEGFTLSHWLAEAGYTRSVQAALAVQRLINTDPDAASHTKMPLDSYHQALELVLRRNTPDGQILFLPCQEA